MATVQHLSAHVDAAEIHAVLERDGALIIDDLAEFHDERTGPGSIAGRADSVNP